MSFRSRSVWCSFVICDAGTVDGGGVAVGASDEHAEQVADEADVAAAGVAFVEDAVLADGLGAHAEVFADPDPPPNFPVGLLLRRDAGHLADPAIDRSPTSSPTRSPSPSRRWASQEASDLLAILGPGLVGVPPTAFPPTSRGWPGAGSPSGRPRSTPNAPPAGFADIYSWSSTTPAPPVRSPKPTRRELPDRRRSTSIPLRTPLGGPDAWADQRHSPVRPSPARRATVRGAHLTCR